MTTIIDYGIGNLRSIEKAFEHVGASVERTDDPEAIAAAERLVLPGVGAFGACMDEVRRRGLVEPIREAVDAGTPLLGVCIGMQLLFDASEEQGKHEGLGLLPGRVVHFSRSFEEATDGTAPPERSLKVPHMGWNTALATRSSPLLDDLGDQPYFYFVHSYHAQPVHSGDVLATTTYGAAFPAMVHRDNVYGVQFHPEKSQRSGLKLLENFAAM